MDSRHRKRKGTLMGLFKDAAVGVYTLFEKFYALVFHREGESQDRSEQL